MDKRLSHCKKKKWSLSFIADVFASWIPTPLGRECDGERVELNYSVHFKFNSLSWPFLSLPFFAIWKSFGQLFSQCNQWQGQLPPLSSSLPAPSSTSAEVKQHLCLTSLSHHSQDQEGFYFFFLLLSHDFLLKVSFTLLCLGLYLQFAILFYFKILYWCIVGLQCCVSSRWTAKWISYTYTYIYSFFDSFPI